MKRTRQDHSRHRVRRQRITAKLVGRLRRAALGSARSHRRNETGLLFERLEQTLRLAVVCIGEKREQGILIRAIGGATRDLGADFSISLPQRLEQERTGLHLL